VNELSALIWIGILGGHVEKCALAVVPAAVVYPIRIFFVAAATPAREWDGINRCVAKRVRIRIRPVTAPAAAIRLNALTRGSACRQ